jgi:alcohol dehydrogenase
MQAWCLPSLVRPPYAELSTRDTPISALSIARQPAYGQGTAASDEGDDMKALVYKGPGQKSWEEVPDPVISQPSDIIVKIDTTTICGTDLHILKGDVPAVTPGRILGHEGVGTITQIGDAVTTLKVGDQVILSCISACGKCAFCKKGVYSHCLGDEGASGTGWIFGHLIDGTQAEYVRVPYAENSVYVLPPGVSPQMGALLSDILPTGHEIGVQYGHVKPGDVVAVVGTGPVGLAAIATAGLYGPSRIIAIDLDSNRVEQARKFGATDGVVSSEADWKQQVLDLTDGLGVDVAIEAVGIPLTFQMCLDIVRPAGHVANVGVHGTSVELALQDLWISNIIISMGLVNTDTLATLLSLVAQGKIPTEPFISHTFSLSSILDAYDVFERAAETKALKVMINA